MSAYYNEIDPFAAQWLRELIKAKLIADGVVDERSITEVEPSDLKGFNQCHFFAGIGVWSYALRKARWPDDRKVWTGSCPCQPFSTAGQGTGFDDERHLWPTFYKLIDECKPPIVFGEQVASKAGLEWIDLVQTDLEASDYSFGAADLCAAGVGAPHVRQRLYWVANSNGTQRETVGVSSGIQKDPNSIGWSSGSSELEKRLQSSGDSIGYIKEWSQKNESFWGDSDWLFCRDGKWRSVEPGTFPLADGVASRVGLLRGYGNAIVAPVAQIFIESIMEIINES